MGNNDSASTQTLTSVGLAVGDVICLLSKNFGTKTQKGPVQITKIKGKRHIAY